MLHDAPALVTTHPQYPPHVLPGSPVNSEAASTQQKQSVPCPQPRWINSGTPPTEAHVAIAAFGSFGNRFEMHAPNTASPSMDVTQTPPATPHRPSEGSGGNTEGGAGGVGLKGGGTGLGGGMGGGGGIGVGADVSQQWQYWLEYWLHPIGLEPSGMGWKPYLLHTTLVPPTPVAQRPSLMPPSKIAPHGDALHVGHRPGS